ncbi:LysM peptidoglycan-binding domain-containing protein [Aeromicrobium sp. YIM 150415]|uniref:LysM peptidoglycan-binding domain-containing protein n=1 Tax=Aeromicrobium sp. YIM 150415 TaxID=2803912 RepID=UPI0019665864|nr:LysM peptidoglycan-binding domain-containing protein [Aeromicrobium sp. YIM 150415]MBM9464586.1 LysM peptidoglycan-binding domain-containing protein [Aeromicrobium sp. YIM 150415]
MRRPWLTLGALLTTAAGLPHWPVWWSRLTTAIHDGDLTGVVTWAAALLGSALLAWIGLVGVVAVVHLPTARRLAPTWLLTLAIGTGVATTAVASGHPLDGAPLPNRAVVTEAPAVTNAPTSVPAVEHVVASGDTLWAIAAAHLPADADMAVIGESVDRWHEENRQTIGDDPGVILPGQVLRAPEVR